MDILRGYEKDANMINQFRGKDFYLSNFYEVPVLYEGILYGNNEAAFQAQKTLDIEVRKEFARLSPSNAKRKGRVILLRSDWDNVKEQVMYKVCRAKFEQHPDLMEKLLLTGNRSLEEGNTWGDREWGTVNGVGKNKLGKILMKIREEERQKKDQYNMLLAREEVLRDEGRTEGRIEGREEQKQETYLSYSKLIEAGVPFEQILSVVKDKEDFTSWLRKQK